MIFKSLKAVEERLLQFQDRYEEIAKPFEWKFTRADLSKLLMRLSKHSEDLHQSA